MRIREALAQDFRLPRFLRPDLGALSNYTAALALVATILVDGSLRRGVYEFGLQGLARNPFRIVPLAILAGGVLFSLVNVFCYGRKPVWVKRLTLYATVTINGAVAFAAGVHLLTVGQGWELAFPFFNVLYGSWLLVCLRGGLIDEQDVPDDYASPLEVAVTTVLLLVVLAVCKYMLQMHWTVTMSACVGYSSTLGALATTVGSGLLRRAADVFRKN